MTDSNTDKVWWDEFDFEVEIRQSLLMKKIHEEDTGFQKLEIYEHGLLGTVMVLDDILQTTTKDEFIYSEMMAHVPILGRAQAPKSGEDFSVLIIGGGDGGVIREVLKHSMVTACTMVDLDGKVVEAANKYLGFQGDYEEPRAQLIIGDGAAFLKSEEIKANPYDAIIVDCTDPYGPGEVLFTEEFFSDLYQALKPGGTTMRHVGIPFHQGKFLKTGTARMKTCFPNVQLYRATIPSYTGGEMGFLIGSRDGYDCSVPCSEFRGRYYTPEIHQSSFVLPPYLKEMMI